MTLPSLPLVLVFYVDSTTKALVKPKNHIYTSSCWVSSEITNQEVESFFSFDFDDIKADINTPSQLNTYIFNFLKKGSPVLYLSFSKYPNLYYNYLGIAHTVLIQELEKDQIEECYPLHTLPFLDDNYTKVGILKSDGTYIDEVGIIKPDGTHVYTPSENTDFSYISQPGDLIDYRSNYKLVQKGIPTIDTSFNLTKKCLVINHDGDLFLYIDNLLCGYKVENNPNQWYLLSNTPILQPSCVRDFNKLTANSSFTTVTSVDLQENKYNPNQKEIKTYLLNLLSLT